MKNTENPNPQNATLTLMTWNIHWGVGVGHTNDKQPNLPNIASVILQHAPDIVCLQEVSRHFPANTGGDDDQFDLLLKLLPAYEGVFTAATDYANREQKGAKRRQFGNAILTTGRVLSAKHHVLPSPQELNIKQFTDRAATTAIIRTRSGTDVGVVNTHLEYSGILKRTAQIQAIASMVHEQLSQAAVLRPDFPQAASAFSPLDMPSAPSGWLLAGDFNCAPSSKELMPLINIGLQDTWPVCHPQQAHAATLGVHICPPGYQPQNFDRIYASPYWTKHIETCCADLETQASDHQPVLVRFKI